MGRRDAEVVARLGLAGGVLEGRHEVLKASQFTLHGLRILSH